MRRREKGGNRRQLLQGLLQEPERRQLAEWLLALRPEDNPLAFGAYPPEGMSRVQFEEGPKSPEEALKWYERRRLFLRFSIAPDHQYGADGSESVRAQAERGQIAQQLVEEQAAFRAKNLSLGTPCGKR